MAPESVKNLIRKIYELTQRGVGGEADAARRKLDLLLVKYGVTLDDVLGDAVKTYEFHFRNEWDESLMTQLYYAVTQDREKKIWQYSRAGKKVARKIGLDLTAEQYVDFQEQLKHYRAAWKKEQARLFAAFCHQHNLLRPADSNAADRKYSDEEIREHLRMKQMMRGLNEKSFFRPAGMVEHKEAV